MNLPLKVRTIINSLRKSYNIVHFTVSSQNI